jgi:hypothetical protein
MWMGVGGWVGDRGRFGAEGIAFWYTRDSAQLGPVFGSRNAWDGLGVLFDTYDNDGKVSTLGMRRGATCECVCV